MSAARTLGSSNMAWLVAIARAFGAFLKAVFPDITEKLKERRSAQYIGKDDELQADMEKDLENQLGIGDNSADSKRPNDADNS